MDSAEMIFMVEFDLPSVFTEEFTSRIPNQRMVINHMLEKGKIHSYSLSLNRRKLWAVFQASSESEVWELLDTFPLRDFMTPYIHELMFHNTSSPKMNFSLN